MDIAPAEQFFSTETRDALAEASRKLAERLQAHTEALLAMTGDEEQAALYEQNAALEELVEDWNDAVFEHTGTAPLLLDDAVDEEDDEDTEQDQVISVVSRFDLRVIDLDALLEAGRAAQERHPAELDETVEQEPVDSAEQAIYEIAVRSERRGSSSPASRWWPAPARTSYRSTRSSRWTRTPRTSSPNSSPRTAWPPTPRPGPRPVSHRRVW
jgi:hypothetical protein